MSNLTQVALISNNREIMSSIEDILETEGFSCTKLDLDYVRQGKVNLVDWIEKFDPSIVIYDIGLPHANNINFWMVVQNMKVMDGRCVVLTTTNLKALEEKKSGLFVHEIFGMPFDLDRLFTVVKKICPTAVKKRA